MRALRTTAVWCSLLLLFASAACGRSGSSAAGSADGEVLTGHERFAWDQPASNRAELDTFHYAMYVDGNRVEVSNVSCGTTRSAAGFACACPLPTLAPGSHTLQVSAFVIDGGAVKESSRSAPVRITIR